MNFKQLCTELSKEINPEVAEEMSRVMDGQFLFKGLDASARLRVIEGQLAKAKEEEEEIDWEFVDTCWDQNIREFQYFALSYLMEMRELLEKDDLDKLKNLIIDKPEWDTNNILHKLVNMHTALYPELEDKVVAWSKEKNPWLKRTAILYQLGRGPYTRIDALEKILDNSLNDKETIIRRAIVKALEDARRSHPEFVDSYIERNRKKLAEECLQEYGL